MEKLLSVENVLDLVESLSHSQGFYCRMRESFNQSMEIDKKQFYKEMNNFIKENNIKSDIDFIFAVEC